MLTERRTKISAAIRARYMYSKMNFHQISFLFCDFKLRHSSWVSANLLESLFSTALYPEHCIYEIAEQWLFHNCDWQKNHSNYCSLTPSVRMSTKCTRWIWTKQWCLVYTYIVLWLTSSFASKLTVQSRESVWSQRQFSERWCIFVSVERSASWDVWKPVWVARWKDGELWRMDPRARKKHWARMFDCSRRRPCHTVHDFLQAVSYCTWTRWKG